MEIVISQVPPSQDMLSAYGAAAHEQGYPPLTGSPDGYIFLADQTGAFMCGVTIFDTKGVYTFFDDFVVSRAYRPRVRHAAGEMLAHLIISHTASLGKTAVCPTQSKGAEMCLTRLGFEPTDVVMMTRKPAAHPIDSVEAEKTKRSPLRVVPEPVDRRPAAKKRRKPRRRAASGS